MLSMNVDWTLGAVAYGSKWRVERRFLHEQLHINAVQQWQEIELRMTRAFLQSLLEVGVTGDISERVGKCVCMIAIPSPY